MAVHETVREAIPPEMWERIRTEWRVREFRALRETVLKAVPGLDNAVLNSVDQLLFVRDDMSVMAADDSKAHATDVLYGAFVAAGDGEPLLALYVYGRCLEKWEISDDYGRVRTILDALGDVTKPEDPPTDLLSIIVLQARLVNDAMNVEEALNCSCPVALGEGARSIVRRLDVLLEQEQTLGDSAQGLRQVVRSDAVTSRCYFDAIELVAAAVRAFVERDAPGVTDFARVLEMLSLAERDPVLDGDVYQSELLSHRAAVEALGDHAAKPRLRIDSAELVYMYPFALEGRHDEAIDPQETLRLALEHVVWPRTGLAELLAADELDVDLSAHEVDLNDVWVGEPAYAGAWVQLPPITVTTTARERLEFAAEVRLGRLGSHYVRVSSGIRNAGLHQVNQALRRGSPGMGAEEVRSGDRTWAKVQCYAEDVIEATAAALGAKPVRLEGSFHVVLAARSISVQRPDGTRAPATLDELTHAVGASLLFHPVQHLTTSLEEWIRHPPPPTVTNLLAQRGDVGGLISRTDNTTVAFMPVSPDWLNNEYEEMIEFVASIPPLFTVWENQAWRLTRLVDSYLVDDVLPTLGREFEGWDGSPAREVPADDGEKQLPSSEDRIAALYELHQHVIATRMLESDIRRQLALLGSTALCRTRAQRQFLDGLWKAADLPARESEIDGQLTLLAERQERITATVWSMDQLIRLKRQERAKRFERPVTFVVGFLAAASLAGVLQWINEAFELNARFWWAWGEAAILIAVAVVVGVVIVRALRSP